ncbi:PREDICTED: zinc finger HIT domain-containing protein 3 isoform X1 [Rhagoletis zephyria]|uniref:zinc finger HIT domain-containing protein 3 isoform X1 n=1 Tax=Rhagoletis zephyria TaxID=28612 RepID=UPI0008118F9B|nr:PREDICTED: zinc finger HIT domain-containing protein 3 isoform X1 [Rhagoletis zephyria]
MLCISCQTPTKKYKCSKCLVRYCSLPCYKKHQDTCVSKQSLNIETCEVYSINEPTLHEPFGTEDTVPRSKLELLKHCETLHNLLYNSHLRNLLTEIDVAPDAWKAMKAAMQEPLFLEFADECLAIIEPNTDDYN